MIIKTIVPKLGDPMYYIGKPVMDEVGVRIGSITDINDKGDHFELIINVPNLYSEVNINE